MKDINVVINDDKIIHELKPLSILTVTMPYKRNASTIEMINGTTLIKVVPNPTYDGLIKIISENKMESAKFSLFNLNGKKVSSELITGFRAGINLEIIDKGIYFISLELENEIFRSKLIVK